MRWISRLSLVEFPCDGFEISISWGWFETITCKELNDNLCCYAVDCRKCGKVSYQSTLGARTPKSYPMGLDAEINWAVQNWPNQHTHTQHFDSCGEKKKKHTRREEKSRKATERTQETEFFTWFPRVL